MSLESFTVLYLVVSTVQLENANNFSTPMRIIILVERIVSANVPTSRPYRLAEPNLT